MIMTKVHCDDPHFEIIDLVADGAHSVITIEYSDQIEDHFETFARMVNAQVEIVAVMNISFDHNQIDDDGLVLLDCASAEILHFQMKSRILDTVEEEFYEDVQADIKNAMMRSLLAQRFTVKIDA